MEGGDGVVSAERAAVGGFANVVYADLSSVFCPHDMCEPVLARTIVYRDRSHLSLAFSRMLAQELADRISPMLSPREARVESFR